MKAGDLKHRITLERPVDTTDARGNRRTVWQPFATCMASMADVSGRDFYAAQAYQAQDTVTFGIRWRDALNKECRIDTLREMYASLQLMRVGAETMANGETLVDVMNYVCKGLQSARAALDEVTSSVVRMRVSA